MEDNLQEQPKPTRAQDVDAGGEVRRREQEGGSHDQMIDLAGPAPEHKGQGNATATNAGANMEGEGVPDADEPGVPSNRE